MQEFVLESLVQKHIYNTVQKHSDTRTTGHMYRAKRQYKTNNRLETKHNQQNRLCVHQVFSLHGWYG